MNEVNLTKAVNAFAAVGASSQGTNETRQQTQVGGNNLPSRAEESNQVDEQERVQATSGSLEDNVEVVSDFVQNIQRDLEFSVDRDLDRTVVRVVDSDSGELIRQIPEDIFLELARKLKQDGELQLFNSVG